MYCLASSSKHADTELTDIITDQFQPIVCLQRRSLQQQSMPHDVLYYSAFLHYNSEEFLMFVHPKPYLKYS